jgi:hypothetical protein
MNEPLLLKVVARQAISRSGNSHEPRRAGPSTSGRRSRSSRSPNGAASGGARKMSSSGSLFIEGKRSEARVSAKTSARRRVVRKGATHTALAGTLARATVCFASCPIPCCQSTARRRPGRTGAQRERWPWKSEHNDERKAAGFVAPSRVQRSISEGNVISPFDAKRTALKTGPLILPLST